MQIIHSVDTIRQISNNIKLKGKTVAFVPTMGALHEGHLKLIEEARNHGDIVITSVFVNPTQFGPNEDFERYPRNFERDADLAEKAGCDLIFAPETAEIYPKHFSTFISVKGVSKKFEGEKRPGHFDGVALVVTKLFNAVNPDYALFGQKDFQQTLVIKRLVEDLNMPIDIVVVPTVREDNGLAMSSRNQYLTEEHRDKASIIFKALLEGKNIIEKGERDRKMINAYMLKKLREMPEIHIQYVASATADTLEEPKNFMSGERVVLLISCYLGHTKLIDNMTVTVPFDSSSAQFIEGNIM